MFTINFDLGCRKCNQARDIRNFYVVLHEDINDYTNKSEYAVMKKIEKWMERDNYVCEFCNSGNLEVTNIDINGNYLYDFDTLALECETKDEEMYMINLQKNANGIITTVGGDPYGKSNFKKNCIKFAADFVLNIDFDKFTPHKNGNLFICFTGSQYKNSKFTGQLQRFRFHGFTKEEAYKSIYELLLDYH